MKFIDLFAGIGGIRLAFETLSSLTRHNLLQNVKTLAGKPDIVLKQHNAIIFVHGCFRHQHEGCKRSNIPKSNQDYWKSKLERNVLRDGEHEAELTAKGWRVLTVWECEIKDLESLTRKLKEFLSL